MNTLEITIVYYTVTQFLLTGQQSMQDNFGQIGNDQQRVDQQLIDNEPYQMLDEELHQPDSVDKEHSFFTQNFIPLESATTLITLEFKIWQILLQDGCGCSDNCYK